MLTIAVNGASVRNASGAHVISGHISSVLDEFGSDVRVVILANKSSTFASLLSDHRCDFLQVPSFVQGFLGRIWWEVFNVQGLLDKVQADVLVQPSGYAIPRLRTHQVVISQNPFAFFSEFHRSISQKLKNLILRNAYCYSRGRSNIFFGNSKFMRDLVCARSVDSNYSENVLYQGVFNVLPPSAESLISFRNREKSVLAVSGVAVHKRFDLVISAFLRAAHIDPTLRLKIVGKVDDEDYNSYLVRMVEQAELNERVDFLGWVSRSDLVEHYRKSFVYVSLSECESFGIPAVEAQLWGTPVVIADCCAPPEICGEGAVLVPKGDWRAAADAIIRLAKDEAEWTCLAKHARLNAERFEWSACSKPLISHLRALSFARSREFRDYRS